MVNADHTVDFEPHDRCRWHVEAESVAVPPPPCDLHLVLQSQEVYASGDLQTLIGLRFDLWNKCKF